MSMTKKHGNDDERRNPATHFLKHTGACFVLKTDKDKLDELADAVKKDKQPALSLKLRVACGKFSSSSALSSLVLRPVVSSQPPLDLYSFLALCMYSVNASWTYTFVFMLGNCAGPVLKKHLNRLGVQVHPLCASFLFTKQSSIKHEI